MDETHKAAIATALIVWIAIVGLLVTFSPAATAQEQIPNKAVVQGGSSGPLRAGENYTFEIVLDPPPQRYEEGWIEAKFECEPSPVADVFVSSMDQLCKVSATAKPRNGQTTYDLTLQINELMTPGKWKLVSLSLSQATTHVIPFTGVASFDIPPLHPIKLVDIQRPATTEAGQRLVVKVTVDGYPKDAYKECGVFLGIQLKPPPHEQPADQQIIPNRKSYEFSFRYYPDTPPGPITGQVTDSGRVVEGGPLTSSCRRPALEGNRQFEFAVTSAKDLVTPTSATVKLNRDQIHLFRIEAGQLRDKAKQLTPTNVTDVLHEAMAKLDAAEKEYLALGPQPSSEQAVKIKAFFNDIRLNYRRPVIVPAENSGQGKTAILERVSIVNRSPFPRSADPLADVRESVEHNADAYDAAASSGDITFTLYVFSHPQGAAISYKLRGDDYTSVGPLTDWHIDGLPLGVYCIRLQMSDYKDNELPFDATRTKNMNLDVVLEQKGVQRCHQ